MGKVICVFIVFLCITNCKSKEQTAKERCQAAITKNLHDNAFKNNSTIDIMELNVVKVDTVSKAYVDLEKSKVAISYIKLFQQMAELSLSQAKLGAQSSQLYSGILNSPTLARIQNEKVKDDQNQARAYLDTASYYYKLDSVYRQNIKDSAKSEKIYIAKTFIKATRKTGTETRNTLDTLYYYLDSKLEPIDLSLPQMKNTN